MATSTVMAEFLTTIVGFILLLIVLKRFAWGPVIELLDKRREEISKGYNDLQRMHNEMEATKADYDARLAGIEATAREKLAEAQADGRRIAAEIQENARQQAEESRQQAARNIELQMEQARAQLRDDVVHMVVESTRKVLGDVVDASADHKLVEGYVQDLTQVKRN